MSFGEQGDKFRRRVHTDRGPMYVERTEAPTLPPKHPRLFAAFVTVCEWVLLVAGILGIAWSVFHEDNRGIAIAAVLLLVYSFIDLLVYGVDD